MTGGSAGTPDRRAGAVGLRQRLRVGLEAMEVEPAPTEHVDEATGAGILLNQFVQRVTSSSDRADLWLLLTLVCARFPTEQLVLATGRRLRSSTAAEFAVHLLALATAARGPRPRPDIHAVVLTDSVVVDVDFCATNEHHTGIQRVVRETVPRWAVRHRLVLTAWWADRAAYRRLEPTETARVMEWSGRPSAGGTLLPQEDPELLVVPFHSHVVLPETPEPSRSAALATMGRYSGNTVSMIGYDCIPLVSPELVHPGLPDRFMDYLSIVKHARAVAGISAAATNEFAGYAHMLSAQGLPGPAVSEVALPAHVRQGGEEVTARDPDAEPLVLCVGSFEPRKNQTTVLVAAEQLWREGLRFRLRFIGGGGYRTEFDDVLGRLRGLGRPVEVMVQASDDDLNSSYANARFTVFISLHEGYGLPVTESLAHGTPVLTTHYGSTADIAADGGCLTVDPRDHTGMKDSMRRMLTDDDLIDRLQKEADARAPRSWMEYADATWQVLIEDVRS